MIRMSGNYRENIYRDEGEKRIGKLIELLEKGPENLSDSDLKLLESLIEKALVSLPDVTRSGVEKKKLRDVLKMLIEDLKHSKTS